MRLVQELFERQVEQTPERVAVSFAERSYTYRELNRRANRLAHLLRHHGAGPEVRVGLCLEKSLDLAVGLLGIWKSGAAYVAIDPDAPQERIDLLLEDASIELLVTQSSLTSRLAATGATVVCLDVDERLAEQPDHNPAFVTEPHHLAYMIYTSGSTGKPKGCMVEHRHLVSTVVTFRERFAFHAGDVMPWIASVTFDFSLLELLCPLLVGGRCVVLAREHVLDLPRLVEVLPQFTAFQITPSLMRQVVETIRELPPEPQRFAGVRRVFSGGEAVAPDLLQALCEVFPQADVHVLYGPTETAIVCTEHQVRRGDEIEGFPIGRGLANSKLRLYDAERRLVASGIPGELYIGGAGVARGYSGREALTREKFVVVDGERWYRSGDLVRERSDGTLEFLGRIDHQVKIRGFRIELGEIELAIAGHASVSETVVCVQEERSGDKQLVAYVVPQRGQTMDLRELRAFLQAKLPAYMVPAYMMTLPELPLNTNGKIERRALPAPDPSRDLMTAEYVPPRTPLEQDVAAIWADVLQVERVGLQDRFLELGGHSLLATQIASRIKKAFQAAVALNLILAADTVEALAEQVQRALDRQAGPERVQPERESAWESVIPRMSRAQPLPLSFAQQRLWFWDRMEPGSPLYNLPSAFRLQGALDVRAMERALNEIVRRHESLRTTFAMRDEQPVQVIAEERSVWLPIVHVSGTEAERERQAYEVAREEAQKPFDLQKGPLLRAQLVQIAADDHLLLLTLHHIVSDGWSEGVFRRELIELYGAFRDGERSPLPELPIQYADYASWHLQWVEQEVLADQLAYWKARLSGPLPVLQLPTDRPRPAKQTYRGATKRFRVSKRLTHALKALCEREGVTLYMALLAAFQTLLYRYSGQDDLLVGAPIANRQHSELEGLIGFFINTLVMRTDLSGRPSFRELLRRVREVALGAFAHQDLPFEKLVAEVLPGRDLSYAALTPVMFSFENFALTPLQLSGLTLTPLEADSGTAKFDLTLFMGEAGEELYARFEYNTDLFDESTMERWQESFIALLEGIVSSPEQCISQLPILSSRQRQQLLIEWNDNATDTRNGRLSLAEFFEEQVQKRPDRIAVVYGEQHLTYRELNERANRLAHHLLAQGVGKQQFVGISMERSTELIVALLAIVKAGAAYVPLDPSYPQERLTWMLEDSGVNVLVTQPHLVSQLPIGEQTVICLDGTWEWLTHADGENPPQAEAWDHVVYMIYTSGSTGRPKGVCITQRAVARLVKATNYVEFTADDVFLQFAPISFDASTFEIWACLLNGARLVVAPSGKLSLEALCDVIEAQRVDTLFLTSGLFHQIVEGHLDRFKHVRRLLTGGDVISPAHVNKALHELDGCTVYNCYGPTENTVFTTYHPLRTGSRVGTNVPIGRALANTELYVLDADRQPVPIGVPGELYTGGDGLASGYWRRPELTAEKFVSHPFAEQAGAGATVYRTGDLVRWLPDGNLEFLARIDNQVKIRGFRIELGEIEAALGAHQAVREVVVIAREDVPGDKRLVAYIVTERTAAVHSSELRSYLKGRLPDHMVPNAFVLLDAIPLTINGKADRRALPVPAYDALEAKAAYVAPRDADEERVVQIYADVLGLEQVGIHDNFFDRGGHSLLAMRAISRLGQTFQVSLPLQTLFESPTPAELAAKIKTSAQAAQTSPEQGRPAMAAISRAAFRQKRGDLNNDLD